MLDPTAAGRPPAPFRNVFACLVHERAECVVDLVRNLRRLDPDSQVLLYNGGPDPGLLDRFPFARYGAVVHPDPCPQEWGRLHGFAFDCMRFAVDHFAFDALTVVDSDQLATRPGYSAALAAALDGRPGVGMLVSSPGVKGREAGLLPVDTALAEFALWRPWLRRFRGGASRFVHWSFWPATVFTRDAARDLTRLVDRDRRLSSILERTAIVATEEVVLPTLAALLGYELAARPFRDDYLRFRVAYTRSHVAQALARPDVFWVHPAPRRYDDPLRAAVREAHDHYARPFAPGPGPPPPVPGAEPAGPPDPARAVEQARRLGVGLRASEVRLLAAAAWDALAGRAGPCGVVVAGPGSAGLAAVLAPAARAARADAEVFAVDPAAGGPAAGARVLRADPASVPWAYPVGLLVLDGLPDYAALAGAFFHFERWLAPGGRVAVRGGADASAFVREALATGRYRRGPRAGSTAVVERAPG